MNINSVMKNNNSIDLMRLFAAFAVVVIHVTSYYLKTDIQISKSSWMFANLLNAFSRWSVPIFIMISGTLLINEKSFLDANLFFKKRMRRILIPLVFWSIFFIMFNVYIYNFFSIKDLIGRLYIGEPYYHLWYLYLILGIYFVTPIVSLIHENFDFKYRLKIIVTIFIAGSINNIWLRHFGQNNLFFAFKFISYLGYFMIGKELSKLNFKFNKYFYLAIWFFISVTIALFTLFFRNQNLTVITYFYDYLNPLVIIQSISIFIFMIKFKLNTNFSTKFKVIITKLSGLTFGIYIIHPIFVDLLFKNQENLLLKNNIIFTIPFFTLLIFILSGIVVLIFSKTPLLRRLT